MRVALLSVPLLLIAVPASALQTAATPATADLPVAAKPKKVCRTASVTGQRIAKTICHTKEEWASIDQMNESAAKDFTNNVGNNATRGAAGGGGLGGVNAIP
jgi:hypothetical protein